MISRFLFISLVLSAATFATAQVNDAHPAIDVAESGWDFGTRRQGVKDEKRVRVTNTGSARLVIKNIKVTCGCVRGRTEKQELDAGESTDLVLMLNTSRQMGPIRKHCYLYTNDPKRPVTILTINGNILGAWKTSTRSVQFGRFEAGSEVRQSFDVIVEPGQAVSIKRIVTSSGMMSHVIEPYGKIDEEHGFHVHLTLAPEAAPGPFSCNIRVETTNVATPVINVMCHARISGAIEVKPRQTFLGRVFWGKTKSVRFELKKKDGDPFEIKKLETSSDRARAKYEVVEKGRHYRVTLSVSAAEGDENIDGILRIHTNDKKQKIIGIDYIARAAPIKTPNKPR